MDSDPPPSPWVHGPGGEPWVRTAGVSRAPAPPLAEPSSLQPRHLTSDPDTDLTAPLGRDGHRHGMTGARCGSFQILFISEQACFICTGESARELHTQHREEGARPISPQLGGVSASTTLGCHFLCREPSAGLPGALQGGEEAHRAREWASSQDLIGRQLSAAWHEARS